MPNVIVTGGFPATFLLLRGATLPIDRKGLRLSIAVMAEAS
jgi:hypothetical protein